MPNNALHKASQTLALLSDLPFHVIPEHKRHFLAAHVVGGFFPTFGLGDQLGLATPGHIAAVRGTKFAPIFAQQSVRENARIGLTPQQVVYDAKRAAETAKWDTPWGAESDHLKTLADFHPYCVGQA